MSAAREANRQAATLQAKLTPAVWGWLLLLTRKKADSKIILHEGEEIIVCNMKVPNVFNGYFCDIDLNTGFDDSMTSSYEAIAKHLNHLSICKSKDLYKISDDPYGDVSTIDKKLCNIDYKNPKDMIRYREHYSNWLIRPWSFISRTW